MAWRHWEQMNVVFPVVPVVVAGEPRFMLVVDGIVLEDRRSVDVVVVDDIPAVVVRRREMVKDMVRISFPQLLW